MTRDRILQTEYVALGYGNQTLAKEAVGYGRERAGLGLGFGVLGFEFWILS
jgi:hypothetical protein